ncbi:MAG: hypothetical protein CVU39_09850 [Chloroflexi bacterium HGW-Chloroflexi-10]|nr:MAG: hypothetical protein CVU39_09850 [Chloroflexi bacterium HGW-Chloroflexi-10]
MGRFGLFRKPQWVQLFTYKFPARYVRSNYLEDLKRILVVDDDIELLNSIKRILFNKRGIWDLDFVDSVSLAKEKLSTKKYDVVLTDIQMPEQDGFSLISFMRNEAIDTSIPIVVFSGLGDTRLKQRVLNLGVTDFLNKPINSSELIARLQNVITLKIPEYPFGT